MIRGQVFGECKVLSGVVEEIVGDTLPTGCVLYDLSAATVIYDAAWTRLLWAARHAKVHVKPPEGGQAKEAWSRIMGPLCERSMFTGIARIRTQGPPTDGPIYSIPSTHPRRA